MILEMRKLCAGYHSGAVLHDVDMRLEQGEIVTLLGANGAGKSTLAKAISGSIRPRSGEIVIEGRIVNQLSPAARLRLGVIHVPEGRQIFSNMTVAENLRLGTYFMGGRSDYRRLNDKIAAVLAFFPALEMRLQETAGNLSGGQQQMLAIARGLMGSPRVLILDEPSLGLSPILVEDLFDVILKLREQGISILLVEQNARAALAIADRAYVLENGRVTLTGSAAVLSASDEIAERYLGSKANAAMIKAKGEVLAAQLRSIA